jgi:hypothetical protein
MPDRSEEKKLKIKKNHFVVESKATQEGRETKERLS